jgi:hypothetical protein
VRFGRRVVHATTCALTSHVHGNASAPEIEPAAQVDMPPLQWRRPHLVGSGITMTLASGGGCDAREDSGAAHRLPRRGRRTVVPGASGTALGVLPPPRPLRGFQPAALRRREKLVPDLEFARDRELMPIPFRRLRRSSNALPAAGKV